MKSALLALFATATLLGTGLGLQAEPGVGRLVEMPGFPSAQIGAREVDVWLPPGYDARFELSWPVIYMMDGQNLFVPGRTFGGVAWSIDKAIESLIAQGRTRGAIVVGVWNAGANRAGEYMPSKAAALARTNNDPTNKIVKIPNSFTSDAFLRFLVTELKPYVDSHYRTLPGRDHTFVMGSSMGGLISAYAICEYPNVFGAAACVSTHWTPGDGCMIDYLKGHLPDPATHRIYFDHGTETLDAHYPLYQARADQVMKERGYVEGVTFVSRVFPGAEHSEKSWSQRADIPLAFLLQ